MVVNPYQFLLLLVSALWLFKNFWKCSKTIHKNLLKIVGTNNWFFRTFFFDELSLPYWRSTIKTWMDKDGISWFLGCNQNSYFFRWHFFVFFVYFSYLKTSIFLPLSFWHHPSHLTIINHLIVIFEILEFNWKFK